MHRRRARAGPTVFTVSPGRFLRIPRDETAESPSLWVCTIQGFILSICSPAAATIPCRRTAAAFFVSPFPCGPFPLFSTSALIRPVCSIWLAYRDREHLHPRTTIVDPRCCCCSGDMDELQVQQQCNGSASRSSNMTQSSPTHPRPRASPQPNLPVYHCCLSCPSPGSLTALPPHSRTAGGIAAPPPDLVDGKHCGRDTNARCESTRASDILPSHSPFVWSHAQLRVHRVVDALELVSTPDDAFATVSVLPPAVARSQILYTGGTVG